MRAKILQATGYLMDHVLLLEDTKVMVEHQGGPDLIVLEDEKDWYSLKSRKKNLENSVQLKTSKKERAQQDREEVFQFKVAALESIMEK